MSTYITIQSREVRVEAAVLLTHEQLVARDGGLQPLRPVIGAVFETGETDNILYPGLLAATNSNRILGTVLINYWEYLYCFGAGFLAGYSLKTKIKIFKRFVML